MLFYDRFAANLLSNNLPADSAGHSAITQHFNSAAGGDSMQVEASLRV
jgi:hypothetical protein